MLRAVARAARRMLGLGRIECGEAAAMRALGPLGGGASWSGALSLARDSGAAAETCPGVYAYLPYGARAFLVVAAIAAACALPTPTPAVDDVDDEERKDPDDAVPFSPSFSSEKEVEMV